MRILYCGINRQENDAGASPASPEQFKNKWHYTSILIDAVIVCRAIILHI
jgi:hypothetical protein